jgi:hypothetical protein
MQVIGKKAKVARFNNGTNRLLENNSHRKSAVGDETDSFGPYLGGLNLSLR